LSGEQQEPDDELILTPEQEAEGWRIETIGGMRMKVLSLNEDPVPEHHYTAAEVHAFVAQAHATGFKEGLNYVLLVMSLMKPDLKKSALWHYLDQCVKSTGPNTDPADLDRALAEVKKRTTPFSS
jgi:hypothetical protein